MLLPVHSHSSAASTRPTSSRRRRALARFAGVGILLALTATAYMMILGASPALAEDFKTFYAAAGVLHQGGNPYDIHQIVAMERRLFPMGAEQQAWAPRNPYIQGILPIAVLTPLLSLPWPVAFAVWTVVLAACLGGALALLARGWPIQRRPSRTLLLAGSPVVFVGLLLGQADAVILLTQCAGALFLARRRPALAGLVLSVGLFKPQVIAGTLILAALIAWRERFLRRYLVGALGGVAATCALGVFYGGPAILAHWGQGLLGFGQAVVPFQVNISSLSALGILWWPRVLALQGVVLVMAWCLGMVALFRRSATPRQRWAYAALGQALWFLVTPYAHPHDDILLLPVLWWVWHADVLDTPALRLGWAVFWALWWLCPDPFLKPLFALLPHALDGVEYGLFPVLGLCAILLGVTLRASAAGSPASFLTGNRGNRDGPPPVASAADEEGYAHARA